MINTLSYLFRVRNAGFIVLASMLLTGCEEEGPEVAPSAPSVLLVGAKERLRGHVGEKLKSVVGSKVGIMPFPPDITAEAVDACRSVVSSNGDLYIVQLDNGIPWEAALSGDGYDKKLLDEWKSHRNSRSSHQDLYLAIAPLKMDRSYWADGYDGALAPKWVRDAGELNDQMVAAYINYTLEAVEYFGPDYLNVGVEAGELAEKDAALWRQMELLYARTYDAVKARYPDLMVGMSFTLPVLMAEGNLEKSKAVIEKSDFVGVSFYPYLDDFYRSTSGIQLEGPPDQWRKPLNWLAENVSKPIAICETAYSSEDVVVKAWNLDMSASPDLQVEYVEDLARYAARDNYLFTVFFLPIDYDRLAAKLPESVDIMALWQSTGFFDMNYFPKPAWYSYRKAWLGRERGVVESALQSSQGEKAGSWAGVTASSGSEAPVVGEGPGGSASLVWQFEYRSDFEWIQLDVSGLSEAWSDELGLNIRSDRSTALLLQLTEASGEKYFAVLEPEVDWRRVELAVESFSLDEGTRKNGMLELGEVASVMLADGGVKDSGASGSRTVEVAIEGVSP
ncbi:glycosyl hydrolase 53 family protein [Pelagicoccus sp. SDUM812005]|nr:glycosyl hydrolase 53 family protein [Pelagicoccus sp. SDUM812005]